MGTENTDTELEEQETEVSETSEDEQEPSSEADSEQKDEKEEPEKDDKSKEKPKEESFEEKVNRLAQSKADKSTKTYQQKLEAQTKQIEELTTQLTERTWDTGINSLFEEESESQGEDVAAKKKAAREKVKEQVLEFQKNRAFIEKTKPILEQKEAALSIVERDQKARNDIWTLLFPEDKTKVDQLQTFLKEFEKANDWDDYEIILESISSRINAGQKKFKPDSSSQGGGGVDLNSLSPRELLVRGEKKKKS